MRWWVVTVALAACTSETVAVPTPYCEPGEARALCAEDEAAVCGGGAGVCDGSGEPGCEGSTSPPVCVGTPRFCVVCVPGPSGPTLACAQRCFDYGTRGEGFDDSGQWIPSCLKSQAPDDLREAILDSPRCILDPTGTPLPNCGRDSAGFALNDPVYLRCQRP